MIPKPRAWQTLRMKQRGALIPWDCVLMGHALRPHPAGSNWWYCARPGCTFEAEEHGPQTAIQKGKP